MSDTFYTLDSVAEGIYKEKMSKFLSFAIPVTSSKDAKEVISGYQKKYFDARHVCWAYMIGTARSEFMSNDNGEPSGTAGKPILGQINSFNLTNIAVVVVRYFGGIKLGTSGLIAAYREAARSAIEAGHIIECHEMVYVSFVFPYLAMNDVMKVVKTPEIRVTNQVFDNSCSMTISVRGDLAESIRKRLENIDGVSLI